MNGRALDWNGDEEPNSGDDFWVAYVTHSRDMVRQTMVDMMQVMLADEISPDNCHVLLKTLSGGTYTRQVLPLDQII